MEALSLASISQPLVWKPQSLCGRSAQEVCADTALHLSVVLPLVCSFNSSIAISGPGTLFVTVYLISLVS